MISEIISWSTILFCSGKYTTVLRAYVRRTIPSDSQNYGHLKHLRSGEGPTRTDPKNYNQRNSENFAILEFAGQQILSIYFNSVI